jgi:hypothetical protein
VLKMTNFLDVTHCPCSIKNTDVPEIGISSVNWAQQSRFYLMTETKTAVSEISYL